MKQLNKNIYYFVIFIFTVFIYDGFTNFYIILKNDYNTRMVKYGGYCDKQGYGFVKYINDKYKNKINSNINVNGSLQDFYPPSAGYFYDIKLPILDNNLALIHTTQEDLKEFYKNKYTIIEKKDNCYFAIKK